MGRGPAPTPIDKRDHMLVDDHVEANASWLSGVSCSSDGKETTGGLERDDRGCRPEVRFCRTTGAYDSICRESHDENLGDRLDELFPLDDVRVNGVSTAGSVRVNGALAGKISEEYAKEVMDKDDSLSGKLCESGEAESFDNAGYAKEETASASGKEKVGQLQDVQCPATCRSLSRRGPGRICGRRCVLKYGHICTHRCDEHWGWNLEEMKIYYTKDMDYVGVFAEVNSETEKVIITVLSDGDVYEDGKKGADNSKKIIEGTEEVDSYEKVFLKGEMDAQVINEYVGTGIYDISKKSKKSEKKEKDLCKLIHIAIEDFEARHRELKWLADIPVDVRKDCDIQLESVTGEYT